MSRKYFISQNSLSQARRKGHSPTRSNILDLTEEVEISDRLLSQLPHHVRWKLSHGYDINGRKING